MTPRGLSRARRWGIVGLGVAVLAVVPVTLQALPAHDDGSSAAELLAAVRFASSAPFSGYVEAQGSVRLPISDQFTDVADLFGGRTTMRVWWRSADDWRVDSLGVTGESDLYHNEQGTTAWSYERNRATFSRNVTVRLPQSVDLLPPELAHHVLEGVVADEVSRIPANNVAGVDAPGFRVVPSAPQSSVTSVDIWVEPSSGVPVKVTVHGAGARPVMQTRFLDLDMGMPAEQQTMLDLSPAAELQFDDVVDIAAAANRYSQLAAPPSLGGLDRRRTGLGAVGLYGSGVTLLVAIPLWDPAAGPLRDQLMATPGALDTRLGLTLGADPLNLLLTVPPFEDGSWLLAGTVTPETLRAAARQIAANPLRLRREWRVSTGAE